VSDVGSSDYLDVGLRNASAMATCRGRACCHGTTLCATGGHCDHEDGYREGLLWPRVKPASKASSTAAIRPAMRFASITKYGADMIKVCASGGVLSPTDDVDTPQLTQEELNAIVDEAHACEGKPPRTRRRRSGETRHPSRHRFDRTRQLSSTMKPWT